MAFRLPFRVPQPGPRARAALRYAGIAALALATFAVALQRSLPYDRMFANLKDALADKYDISAEVERGWVPGRIYLNNLSISTRSAKPDDVTTIFIKRIELDAHFLSLIHGNASLDFDAKLGDNAHGFAHLTGNVTMRGLSPIGNRGMSLAIDGKALPAGALPMRSLVGLPVTGKLDLEIAIDIPSDPPKGSKMSAPNWARAEGEVALACPAGCVFGDGKSKLKPILKDPRQQVMVQDGIEFGKLNIDSFAAKVEITPTSSDTKPGKLALKEFALKSPDGELHVDYEMALEREFGESVVTGCLRFKPFDDLLKRDKTTYNAITLSGAERRADGLFHIKLTDRFKEMKRLNLECGPDAKPREEAPRPVGWGAKPVGRPNLTVPEENVKPAPGTPPVTIETPHGLPGDAGATAAPPAGPQREGELSPSGSGSAAGSSGSAGSGPAPAEGSAPPTAPPPNPPPPGGLQ